MTGQVVLRWLLVAMAVAFAVLLVTGLYLVWNYRPDPVIGFGGSSINSLPLRMNDVHEWSARIFLLLAFASGGLATTLAVGAQRWSQAATGLGLLVVSFVASLTGRLLPWDQLGLWAVTVGTDLRGYVHINDASTRFVIVGRHQVDTGTFMAWFRVHTVAIPIVLVALGVILVLLTRASRSGVTKPA